VGLRPWLAGPMWNIAPPSWVGLFTLPDGLAGRDASRTREIVAFSPTKSEPDGAGWKGPAEVSIAVAEEDTSGRGTRMKDPDKSKEQLMGELAELRQRVAELEAAGTERTEEPFLEGRETFFSILQKAPYGVLLINQDERCLYINPEFTKITGHTLDEIPTVGDWFDQAFPDPAYRGEVSERWKSDTVQRISRVFSVVCGGDEVKEVEFRPTLLDSGRAILVLSDITERKRAEEALQESEAKFRNVAEQSPNMIFISRMGRVVYVNRKCEDVTGYTRDEFYSADFQFLTLIAPEHRELAEAAFSRHMRGEEIEPYDLTLVTKNGTRFEVMIITRLIEYAGERAILGTAIDISERKEMEQVLRESEERYRIVSELISDFAYAVCVDPDGSFVAEWMTDAFTRITGFAPDEFNIRSGWERFVHPDDVPRVTEFAQLLLSDEPATCEFRLITKSGEARWIRNYGRPVRSEAQDRVVRIVGAVQDISERRRAEQLLQALNQAALVMEKALTPRGMFTAVAEELDKLGFSCAVFLTDESQSRLFPRYLSYGTQVLEVLERLTGLKAKEFAIPIETVSIYRQGIWQRQTVFVENVEGVVEQVLPRSVKKFAGQITEILKIPKSINAPLVVEDRVIALLCVQSNDLTEADIPAVTAFAHQIATGWRKAQLFEQAQQEIAERKQAETALRESEARYRTLVEQSLQGLVIFGDDGIIFANSVFADMVGYTVEELMSLSVQDLGAAVYPDDRALVWERFQDRLTRKPVSQRYEFRVIRKDGTLRWVEMSPNRVEYHGLSAVQAAFVDITERKQAEAEREQLLLQIQEQVQRVQQIVDTVPEGVLLLDANRQAVLANPVGEKDLVTLARAKVGDTLTHLGDRPLDELLTSPPKGLWHEVATDGRNFQVLARSIEAGAAPSGWLLVIRDVTQQREVERRIHQQERLAAVGQLAAGIAHDFNNIMATIVLYAQMTAWMEGLPNTARERMETINQQAKHASSLIQQILDFSRRAVLERRPLDLAPLLKEHVKLLERTLLENIEIELDYEPGEHAAPLIVNADPARMQQMVTNLALNARDAMPEGGILRIGLERIAVKPGESPLLPEMEPGEWVQMTVSDTGTGISSDVLPHIFEPFFTTKERGRGSGLGLAQVYGIVAQHEGRIDVETQVGKGTTITVYLPLRPSEPSTAVSLRELPVTSMGRGETVLVVEDDTNVRKALVDSLEMLNYRALQAVNGQEALTTLEELGDEIGLVLSDVVMPRMGGVALFHALRERGLGVPVVLLTGHPLEKEMEDLRLQGLADWLPKPPGLERLAEVVARALGTN
jgi:two-component system cell cycle sensor histidine kinase/response regulator CckA